MESFDLIEREASSTLDRAREMVVASDEEYVICGEFIMGCKDLVKKITEYHADDIDRWHKGHKAALAKRDVDLEKVEQAIKLASDIELSYKQEQDRLAQEEADRIAAEKHWQEGWARLAEIERLEREGKTAEAEQVASAPPPPERRQTPFISSLPKVAGLSARGNWKGEIINQRLVNREFCLADQSLINSHIQRFWPKGTPFEKKVLTDEQKKIIEDEIGGVKIYFDGGFTGRVG